MLDIHAAALESFDRLPNSAHVRLPVVAALFGCSPATIWRRVAEGRLPKPKRFGPRMSAWSVAELRAALASMEAA